MTTLIVVVNESTLVDDKAVLHMTAAVSRQIRKHAGPAWGRTPVPIIHLPKGQPVPDGAVPIIILDDSDQAGALGYHDETPDGHQYGRVFAKPVLDNGGELLTGSVSLASVLSHESLEWWVDPACALWADSGTGVAYALEVGDPVEADTYNVPIYGTNVSVLNFVTPEWFDPRAAGGSQFDLLGNLHEPFTMTPGGYVITMQEGAEGQRFAAGASAGPLAVRVVYGDKVPLWRRETKEHEASRTSRRVRSALANRPGPRAAGRPVS